MASKVSTSCGVSRVACIFVASCSGLADENSQNVAYCIYFSARRPIPRPREPIMWSDHAFSSDARPPTSLSLEVVYAAEADATFDAMKVPAEDRRSAVFRTVSGEGEIHLVSNTGSDEAPIVAQVGFLALFLDFHRVRRYRPRHGAWRFWFFEYEGDELPFPLGQPFSVGDAARDEAEARECLEWLRDERPTSAAYASALFTAMVHRWLVAFQAGSVARDSREPHIREAVAEMRRSLGEPITRWLHTSR